MAFCGVVDDSLSRAALALGHTEVAERHRSAAEAAYRRMGADWWLRRVAHRARPARQVEVLHLHPAGGGAWRVGPQGAAALLPDSKGLHYLRLLLQRPGTQVSALDLSDAAAGHAGVQVVEGDLGPPLDPQALIAYRRRLLELDAELDEARAWSDPARVDRLEEERQALIAEVARATGLGGRPRRSGDAWERARVAVRKAIATAVGRIEEVDPAVARLLRDTVSTGGTCGYEPDPARPVRWVLDER